MHITLAHLQDSRERGLDSCGHALALGNRIPKGEYFWYPNGLMSSCGD